MLGVTDSLIGLRQRDLGNVLQVGLKLVQTQFKLSPGKVEFIEELKALPPQRCTLSSKVIIKMSRQMDSKRKHDRSMKSVHSKKFLGVKILSRFKITLIRVIKD